MEKQSTNDIVCPVCSLFMREGISLKAHLQTHSKDKVIEALLKLDPLAPKNVEKDVDTIISGPNIRETTNISVAENHVFALNRSSTYSIVSPNTINNPLIQTAPQSVNFDSPTIQHVGGFPFPTPVNNLIPQSNAAAITYQQFVTNDGNVFLVPVYNAAPTTQPVVMPANNLVANSMLVMPQSANTIPQMGLVNPPMPQAACQTSNDGEERLRESDSANAVTRDAADEMEDHFESGSPMNIDKDEGSDDEEVAEIFHREKSPENGERVEQSDGEGIDRRHSSRLSSRGADDDEDDEDEDEKKSNSPTPPTVCGYESDNSMCSVDKGEDDRSVHNDTRDEGARRIVSPAEIGHRKSPTPECVSASLHSNNEDDMETEKLSEEMAVKENIEFKYAISHHADLPETSDGPHRENDLYILPNNDGIPASSSSEFSFLGLRNSFLTSASLISSVNKTMFADVEMYANEKTRNGIFDGGETFARSPIDMRPFSGMADDDDDEDGSVNDDGDGDGGDDDEEDTISYNRNYYDAATVESCGGSSRSSPFNIQTDERMPARGELSGQESMSGTENSIWELQMQNTRRYSLPHVNETKDVKLGIQMLLNDAKSRKDGVVNKQEHVEVANAVDQKKILKTKMQREFRCFYCSRKFDMWTERRKHIAEEHAEEDGLTIESLFGKRVKCQVEMDDTTVKAENGENGEQPVVGTVEKIVCRLCGTIFETPFSLVEHLRNAHNIKKRSCVCPTCFARFHSADDYREHIQKVHPYECMTCGKTFFTRPGYMLHQKRHMKVKPYSCDACGKSFVTKQKLSEHVNVHTGDNPIKCDMCDSTFKRYSNYQQHKKFLHLNYKRKLKDFVCKCGEVFHSKVKLLWHQEIHDEKPKQCPFCTERFVHMSSLTRHIRKWHNETYVTTWMSAKKLKNLVECPVCHDTFLHTSLQTHMKIHEGVKQYSCSECSKTFRTKWNLQLHRWTHMSRSAKPYKCKLCVKAYIHKIDYDAHLRSHNNQRPYSCNVCGRQFIRKYNCIRHTKEHTEPRSHKCNVCGKLFSRSYYLTEHEKVHTGEKPHVCHICGKLSATKSNHNKHVKMHNVVRESVNTEG